MAKVIAVVTLSSILMLQLACSVTRKMNLLPAPTIPTSGYQADKVIARWTRTAVQTDRMQTTLEVSALYVTWNVRAALVRELIQAKSVTQAELHNVIVQEAFLDERWYEFIISTNSSVEDWADLALDAGIWKLFLVNRRGDSLEPDSIEEWESTSAETWKYYKFINPWSKVYRVRFPKAGLQALNLQSADTEVVTLAIRSYLGVLNLQWELATLPRSTN